jgi:alpha-L-fucosidase
MNRTSFTLVALALVTAMPSSILEAQDIQARKLAMLGQIDAVIARGPFRADWASLEHYQIPEWYQDAKFGIFIHWGVYSVPAFGNEWYPRSMYVQGSKEFRHHRATYGPQDRFGYKDFIPRFTAERFDAGRWAELFRRAGARYVVPVAEHHDGLAMYDCAISEWDAVEMGPKRDFIGALAKSVCAQGLVFGLSSHRAEHWWFFGDGRKFDSDVKDPRYAELYGPARDHKAAESQQDPPDQAFLEDWLLRCCELVDKYQPQVVWLDWWIAQPAFHPYLQKFTAYYYNRGAEWGKGVAVNYKKHGGESFPDTAGVLDIERGQLAAVRPLFWQTDTSVSKNSWGYIANQDYKTVDSIVDDLIDIVSKNGCMLLNIGPKPDGTIPEGDEQILLGIGRWLGTNGAAIFGTRPWKTFGEGPTQVIAGTMKDTKRKAFTAQDVRFTAKGPTLYAIALDWPEDGRLVINSLARRSTLAPGRIDKVRLLGHEGDVAWSRQESGLTVTLPRQRPCENAFVLEISPVDPAPPLGAR